MVEVSKGSLDRGHERRTNPGRVARVLVIVYRTYSRDSSVACVLSRQARSLSGLSLSDCMVVGSSCIGSVSVRIIYHVD